MGRASWSSIQPTPYRLPLVVDLNIRIQSFSPVLLMTKMVHAIGLASSVLTTLRAAFASSFLVRPSPSGYCNEY